MNAGLAIDQLLQHAGTRGRTAGGWHSASCMAYPCVTTRRAGARSTAGRRTIIEPAARISSEEKTRSMSSSRTNLPLLLAMPRRQSTRTRGPNAGAGWICSAAEIDDLVHRVGHHAHDQRLIVDAHLDDDDARAARDLGGAAVRT